MVAFMPLPVNFDAKTCLMTVEVQNIAHHRMLPAKVEPNPVIEKLLPQRLLPRSHSLPKPSRGFDGFLGTSQHPKRSTPTLPSPRGRGILCEITALNSKPGHKATNYIWGYGNLNPQFSTLNSSPRQTVEQ